MATEATIALNRFGIGARPGERESLGSGARAALIRQTKEPDAAKIDADGLPTRQSAFEAFEAFRQSAGRRRNAAPPMTEGAASSESVIPGLSPEQSKAVVRTYDLLGDEVTARVNFDLTTPNGFAARLAWFWSNHFTVSATKPIVASFVGLFEREAIRASLTGRFADMHLAVMRHPAMLLYLDQAQSMGPNSFVGKRRGGGLNENLAREALELHTIGADGGYTQADVTEFARALTGWTVVTPRVQRFAPRDAVGGDFIFIDALHEPGARIILGKRYPEAGEAQAKAVLADLARRPATASRVATQLCRHFIADSPPEAAVAAIAKVFLDTDGDLPSVHQALVARPEASDQALRKFKSPQDFIISSLRMLGATKVERRQIAPAYALLGMRPFSAPSPKGWPDVAEEWATPDALMKRLEWSQALGERMAPRSAPVDIARAALGPTLTDKTAEAIRRAESPTQGVALALMSPEFQRR